MKIPFVVIHLLLFIGPRLFAGDSVTEEVTDKGETLYRERRWLRDGEKLLVESWITEKDTGNQKIHMQSIYAGGECLMTFSQMNGRIAISHPGRPYTLAFTFSDEGRLDRIAVHHPGAIGPQEVYRRRSDGFYELEPGAESGSRE